MSTIERGTPEFRRINLAFFVAGFVTFVTLYDVQPLLPVFAVEFRVSPAVASLALSLTTGSLSIAMIAAGTLSEAYGRKPIMVFSLLLTSALTVLSALSWSFRGLLFLRLVQGLALAGVTAVAMAYLGEEMSPSSLSGAMGLYISGNAILAVDYNPDDPVAAGYPADGFAFVYRSAWFTDWAGLDVSASIDSGEFLKSFRILREKVQDEPDADGDHAQHARGKNGIPFEIAERGYMDIRLFCYVQ